jgi:L-ascorbate metabolism protein UlaG (beta-lactamase superfamily)
MFSQKGTLSPVLNAPNEHLNNPLTELPMNINELINVDAILVTHTHRDHFDEEAISNLPKYLPLFCQPEDEHLIKEKGFLNVVPISEDLTWEGIRFIRTTGKHGKGELAVKMGPVSGFILKSDDEPTFYIIGDSVWYSEIEDLFHKYSPEVSLLFAGQAQFLVGDPITMGLYDIDSIVKNFPNTRLVVSHMESWNHCVLTRKEIREYAQKNNLGDRVKVPENGEKIVFSTVR